MTVYYIRACVGVNQAVKPAVWRKRRKVLQSIFSRYGTPEKTSASCFMTNGLDKQAGERMKKELKAAGFFVCRVKHGGGK